MKIKLKTVLLLLLFTFFSCKKEAIDYKYLGHYKYEITNDSLFKNNSFLSPESYGYVIGNLNFENSGISIYGTQGLDSDDEYILTMRHPIKSVENDSENIRNEGQEHLKKNALEVILNKNASLDSVYIYRLKPKGKYRLLLP